MKLEKTNPFYVNFYNSKNKIFINSQILTELLEHVYIFNLADFAITRFKKLNKKFVQKISKFREILLTCHWVHEISKFREILLTCHWVHEISKVVQKS